jgi:hypothetical protein
VDGTSDARIEHGMLQKFKHLYKPRKIGWPDDGGTRQGNPEMRRIEKWESV